MNFIFKNKIDMDYIITDATALLTPLLGRCFIIYYISAKYIEEMIDNQK